MSLKKTLGPLLLNLVKFSDLEMKSMADADAIELLRELEMADRAVAKLSVTMPLPHEIKVTSALIEGDLEVPAGRITIGPVAASKGNILATDGGLQIRTNTTVKIDLQTDGDVFIGSDTSAPGTTAFIVFSTAQTYNGESIGAGDSMFGDNTASKANLFWDKSAGTLAFRSGVTPKTTINVSGNMDIANAVAIHWYNAAGAADKAYIYMDSADAFVLHNRMAAESISFAITSTAGAPTSLTWKEDPGLAERNQLVVEGGTQGVKITLTDASALADTTIQVAGSAGGTTQATFPGALNVGTPTGTTAGNASYSGDLVPARNATTYTGYVFVPLAAPLTSTSWDGDAYSTTAKTVIDLSTVFSAPAGIKAVLLRVLARDSGSAASSATEVVLSPNDTASQGLSCRCAGNVNDVFTDETMVVPCDANGDIFYQVVASGASTLDVHIQIWGYWI